MSRSSKAKVSRFAQVSCWLCVRVKLSSAPVGQPYLQKPWGMKTATTSPRPARMSELSATPLSTQASKGSICPRLQRGQTKAARKAPPSRMNGMTRSHW